MTGTRTVKFDDLLRFHFLSRPLFSPDGTRAAFLLTRANLEKDGYDTNLWTVGLEDGFARQMTYSNEERTFTWSRDGKSIYFVSKRDASFDKKSSALYSIAVDGGEANLLGVIPQPVSELWDMPDGKLLVKTVYESREPNPENARYNVFTQIPFWQNGKDFTGQNRAALAFWSPETGELSRLTPDRTDVQYCVVSRDGKKALLIAEDYRAVKQLVNHIYELDLENGGMICLSEGLEYSFKAVGWCGPRIVVVASDMKRYGMNQNPTIFELKDGQMNSLAPELDTSFHNSIVGDCRFKLPRQYGLMDERGVIYISTEDATSRIHVNDLSGAKGDRCVTPDLLSSDCFDIADGKILVVGSSGLNLQELYLVEGGRMKRLTHHNDAVTAELKLSNPVHALVDNGGGTQLDLWYIKPTECEEGKKYPAILDIHGGPKTTYGAGYLHEAQCWASRGYAVIYTNPRGSDGRGNEFADPRGKYGCEDFCDIMAVVDWAVKNLDFIDSERLGVTGGSYGGFMTNWIVSHTDRFKCAASQRGISNWISFDGVSDIGYYFGPDQHCGSGPLTDAEAAWNASPLKYAKNVKTPTLFIHSEKDRRCPDEQVFQMFTALRANGVETRLCYFLGENHELSRSGKPRSRLARLREITDWMDKFLKK